MFKTDSFLGNKKLNLNQNVWCDHATMQQDVLLHFWVIFYIEIRLKYEKNHSVDNSEATWKKATKCNKKINFSTNQFWLEGIN